MQQDPKRTLPQGKHSLISRVIRASLLGVTLISALASGNILAASDESPKSTGLDPQAAYSLGLKYLNGDGVTKDEARAFDLIWESTRAGNADSFATLGYFFAKGIIVEKDESKARYYFELGAEKGSSSCQLNLGRYLIHGYGGPRDPEKGLSWLKKAATGGSTTARLALAETYFFGDHAEGYPDFRSAYEIYLPLAMGGNPTAQNAVGVIVRDGLAGDSDPNKAREWFEKSALQGNAKACGNLGNLIDIRSPDRATRIEALRWLLVAKSLNEQTARVTLDEFEDEIKPDELSEAQTLAAETRRQFPTR